MSYRPDIDGLRAVAVLSVLAFHLSVPGVRGGFVGVDVFFVISGFLITGLLLKDLDRGTFTVVDFYRRRVRRIFPALLVVLAVTSVAALLVLFPSRLEDYRAALLAASLFSSNAWFWQTSDYFSDAADSEALLHTWSLSVEEQFYVLFPLLLLVLHRRRRRVTVAALWLLTAGSFALSTAWVLGGQQSAAFYLLPSRAWELGVGALLAAGAVPALRAAWLRHLVSLGGLASIAFAVLVLPETAPFPGPTALAPVLGAAALIHAGPTSLGGRLLAVRPAVLVGLVSYSLYLWHWPVLVLYRALDPSPGLPVRLLLGLLAGVLAVLTWRYVEQPARAWRFPTTRSLLGFTGASLAACACLALVLPGLARVVVPQPADVSELVAFSDGDYDAQFREGTCFLSSAQMVASYDEELCLRTDPDRPDLLLLGDSFAADLWQGLQEENPQVDLLQATVVGCRPVVGGGGEGFCRDFRDRVLDEVVPALDLDGVVLSGSWQDDDVDRLPATVRQLRRHVEEVVVVGPRPLYTAPLPDLLARQVAGGSPTLAEDNRLPEPERLDARLRAMASSVPFRYVSPQALLCDDACRVYAEPGVPVQFDYGHFTLPGARLVGRGLREALAAP